MSKIKTTTDGFSFHTMELKVRSDSESFNKALQLLYAAAKKPKNSCGTTYPLTEYKTKSVKPHCSTLLSPYGILLYLTETVKDGWHNYTIKAVVNPRKVLDPECSYLGIAPTDSKSLERFQDEFTTLMRKYHLPEFLDEWTLTRLDLCVNLEMKKMKSAREFCRLLQKDLLPPKLERVFFFDPDADKEGQKKQKEADQHSVYLKNNSYGIVVYDKLYQAKAKGLSDPSDWEKLPDGILRLELRCFRDYLDKLTQKERLNSTSAQIYWMAQHSRELILKKTSKVFSGGTHYKPDTACQIIETSGYHETTREQLQWLVNRARHPFTLQQLEKGAKKNFDLKTRTFAKRLEQLENLGINLVPLRKDFYLEQLPSLPLILGLLDDDSTVLKLNSDGTINY